VFFHGAHTFPGFDFAARWADHFRVLVPVHPGFGESSDDETISSMDDYVLHYLALFDAWGIDRFRLIGHSMGGWLAARFASLYPERVIELVLASPLGLRSKDYPAADLFRPSFEELPDLLVTDRGLFDGLPLSDPDFAVARYREATSFARLSWERPYDPTLSRWLRRVTCPTLLLWGSQDRIVPRQQADLWKSIIPHAEVSLIDGVGHLPFNEGSGAAERVSQFLTTG
jgi:pimeloyl-ACP methyl ester carboxylesterase